MISKIFSIIGVTVIASILILFAISLYNERNYTRRMDSLMSNGYSIYQADSIIERENSEVYQYPWIIQ